MKVQVRHFLTAGLATINDHVVAVAQAFVGGDLRQSDDAVTDDRSVLVGEMRQGDNLFLGDYQYVNRSLGVDVPKGQTDFVFVNDVSRDFTVDDFLKDGRHDDGIESDGIDPSNAPGQLGL
jgi:hypothetical protein